MAASERLCKWVFIVPKGQRPWIGGPPAAAAHVRGFEPNAPKPPNGGMNDDSSSPRLSDSLTGSFWSGKPSGRAPAPTGPAAPPVVWCVAGVQSVRVGRAVAPFGRD